MDVYQINRAKIVCFTFHDDLLFFSLYIGKKADYNLHSAGIKRFFKVKENDVTHPEFSPEIRPRIALSMVAPEKDIGSASRQSNHYLRFFLEVC